MKVKDVIAAREIKEVVHFTTNRGLLGILYGRSVKSRPLLNADQSLEHIAKPNAAYRKDVNWLSYVNLSISRINSPFFEVSSERWHRGEDLWWAIVSFSPDMLSHDGVVFTTTNNIYTSVKRGTGGKGLEALFAPKIELWNGNSVQRSTTYPLHFTTCEQAEVLYPSQLSTEYLTRVYVGTEDIADELSGQLRTVEHSPIEICVNANAFDRK